MLALFLMAIGALWASHSLHKTYGCSLAGWIEVLAAAAMSLITTALINVVWLQHGIQAQADAREASEQQLHRERHTLEQRVDERTAELRAEVRERQRAEELNRGRNRVLEMMARDEPTPKILEALVETAVNHRTTWMGTLHLLEDETLRLAAGARLQATLAGRLQQIATKMLDAPESVALTNGRPYVIQDLHQEQKPWSGLLVANGAQSVWSSPFLAAGGKPLGTMSIYTRLLYPPSAADIELLEMSCQMASLILERQRVNEELVRSAYHDPLTGLGNRRLGQLGLEGSIQRAKRNTKGVGVLWIDLNKFKQINDKHGHQAGDHVLQEVAKRLTTRVRASDTLARMGGDEFMVVLEGAERADHAEQIAGNLLKLLAEPIDMGEMQFSLTASIGMSFYPKDGDTAETLLQYADLAMYEAKFGDLGVRSFTSALEEERTERQTIEVEMERALEHGGFSLVYQPQCLPTGELAGFEALLRFQHSELGNVPPSRFIPIAEETQLILPLGRWVLQNVCRQIQAWRQAGYQVLPVAVNISSLQFARDDFSIEVAGILAETGVSPSMLELELTESIVMNDFAESARQMEKLKELGVHIAIDDFGTGYSSLSYLHRLPIDALKIDRSFVEMINEMDGTLPIIQAVISMAQTLGLRVVGEGVETLEQMDTLHKEGCDVLQGYLFSLPVSAEEAALFLQLGHLRSAPSSLQVLPMQAAGNHSSTPQPSR